MATSKNWIPYHPKPDSISIDIVKMPCFPFHAAKIKLVLWLAIIIVVSHHRDSNHNILASAFVVVPQQQEEAAKHYYYGRQTTRSKTTQLDAIFRPPTFRRRAILNFFRRILFAAGTVESAVAASPKTRTTTMMVGGSTSRKQGRVVRFVVGNLDGIQGESGTIYIQLRPEWAPRGVKRFEELTAQQFWNDNRVYRVIPGYISQFGIHGNPSVQSKWRSNTIPDDPFHRRSNAQDDNNDGSIVNKYGTVSFSTTSTLGRTTQIFINTNPHGNRFLDDANFVPIGEVIGGTMDVVERFYSGYGSCGGDDEHGCDTVAAGGRDTAVPTPGMIQMHGNSYLEKEFPNLTYIQNASFVAIPNIRKKNFQA